MKKEKKNLSHGVIVQYLFTDIGNIVKIDKDTLLKLIKNSEKLSTLEEWGVDNWINYGEAMQYLDDSPDEVLLKQYLDD